MKVLLMHRDRDFDPPQDAACDLQTLAQDLELGTLWRAMAGDDEFLADVARKALFAGLRNDLDTIRYRQAVLRDCLKYPALIRQVYALAGEAIEKKGKHYFGFFTTYPSSTLRDAIDVMRMFVDMLRAVRETVRSEAGGFASQGFINLFAMLDAELNDDYLARVQEQLKELKFRKGVLLSAELDSGNRGTHYLVRKSTRKRPWWSRLFVRRSAYTFRLAERDEAGARALSEIEGRGINSVANALAQSVEHILGFFQMLRTESAFYVACVNLHEQLTAMGEPVCLPQPLPMDQRGHRFHGLYDACLALQMGRTVVGNTVDAGGKSLVIITGANQGGKSSFLRSIGVAQLMMQCGLFVAAERFEAGLCSGLFTHYKREEDATMKSGKFDEELARMSGIADRVAPDALLVFNESFAATNEREGAEIARQVVCALLDKRIQVFFVTHFYEFAHSFFDRKRDDVLFLRAERLADGTRTFRLVEGEPLDTSHGEDLYKKIFAARTERERAA
ncbi:DNA mismatch repair protein MutS [Herbaspirillum sp. ST 5-3]|uniref:MutS-related protein n=1 Tax=Oxalobacteraceae TaxID=75682 RepID=UPI0010A52B98|nr:DNA mismatch repair protein MutS [Herbaspirillum sp. ST 5-3]